MEKPMDQFKNMNQVERTIFDIIQKKGALTKNELLKITGMKLTTLNRIMKPLEQAKIIEQTAVGESTGGRKPILYDVNTDRYFVIGIDISRTYTKIVITNLKMNILQENTFIMDETCCPTKTIRLIEENIQQLLQKQSISRNNIIGAGLGTVGPLDLEKGLMTSPENFPSSEWKNVHIKELLEQEIDIPVCIDNGANTAVLAEALFGIGKGFCNIAYFQCGVGIRTGVMASNHIIRTTHNYEEAFAHMIVDMDGESCKCGNFGCIQCYSTVVAITQKFIAEIKKGRTSTLEKNIDQVSFKDICSAAEQRDLLAKEVIENAAVVFGIGLANYINILNPQIIILSGPLIAHSDFFYHVCTQTAIRKNNFIKKDEICFSKGGYLKEQAIAVGAAVIAVEQILQTERRSEYATN
jgi:predicted NBD/HSP70 family sugar kinase